MSKLNLKSTNPNEKYLLDYLEANASDSLVERINAGKKTLTGCFAYLIDWARKELKPQGGVAGAPDAVVFGQAIHYFEEDSLDFEKKEPAGEVKVAATPPPAAPVKAKGWGRKAKVVTAEPTASGDIDLDSMLADLDIEVEGEEKKPEPENEKEDELDKAINKYLLHVGEETQADPAPPPAPEERKEPVQMDWLSEFGISV